MERCTCDLIVNLNIQDCDLDIIRYFCVNLLEILFQLNTPTLNVFKITYKMIHLRFNTLNYCYFMHTIGNNFSHL